MNGLPERLLLYAVTDRAWLAAAPAGSDTLARQVEEALLGGVTLVQLREKGLPDADFIRLARQVKAVTDAHGVPLVINDRLAVALAVEAAGLHIGQEDGDVGLTRARLGPEQILGVSVQTPAQACAAEAAGADYLGVGAVFPTSTKPDAAEVPHDVLAAICAAVRLPVVAIGGITRDNAHLLAGSGIAGLAVVSALFAQGPRIRAAAQELRTLAQTICRR